MEFHAAIVPREIIVELKYERSFYLTAGGLQAAATSIHTNDSYDVEPALGGNPTIGLVTYGDFFVNFRNLGYDQDATVTNLQAFAGVFYNTHSTIDSSPTPTTVHRLATNANTVSFALAPTGSPGSQKRWRVKHSITSIVGSDAPLTADNFMGLIDGSLRVADHTYSTFCFDSTTSSNLLTTGVLLKILLTQRVLLYARKEVVA